MIRHLRVIEGGKHKNKRNPRVGLRLFKAYSISNLLTEDTVYHKVKITWYCLEREVPLAPYESLISNYESLSKRDKKILEMEVKRYFSKEEVELLKEYLENNFDLEVEIEEVELPISERGFFEHEKGVVVYDFLELSEKEGYDLPFKAWGYYTTRNSLSSPALDIGVHFLDQALGYLGLGGVFSESELEDAVAWLYDKESLFVKKRDKGEPKNTD